MALRPLLDRHFRDTVMWSDGESISIRSVVVAALGMAVPVIAGLAAGRPGIGFTIGLGALLLAGEPSAPPAQERPSPGSAVFPALIAVVAATAIAGAAWTDAAMIALAGVAATFSGYSRPVGVAAIRFIVYLVLSVGLLDSAGPDRDGAALIFGLGALWNVAVRAMLAHGTLHAPMSTPQRTPTTAHRRAHFRRTLRTVAGWQFTIRLVAGLAVASLLRHLCPVHHYFWIVLTVAILTQRAIEHVPVKTLQRMLGTLAGVGLTWLIVSCIQSPVLLGGIICVLATAVPVVRARNYLAYSALSTPVILLIIDFGKPVATTLLTDRLVATLAGAAIVVAANLALDRLLPMPAKVTPPA